MDKVYKKAEVVNLSFGLGACYSLYFFASINQEKFYNLFIFFNFIFFSFKKQETLFIYILAPFVFLLSKLLYT